VNAAPSGHPFDATNARAIKRARLQVKGRGGECNGWCRLELCVVCN